MSVTVTTLGPGTVEVGTAPLDFTCEVVGAKITHEYEEQTARRVRLCGQAIEATEKRVDGFAASVENDLSAAGLYAYTQANDMTVQPLKFTPNNASGAKWEGQVVVKLPGEIGADEFGEPIVSDIEWTAAGVPQTFAFTPGI